MNDRQGPRENRNDRSDLAALAREAMRERGLSPEFEPAVLAEVAAMPSDPPADGDVLDLTGLCWVSIDNDDSRDLDQLSVGERLADGGVKVLVAIADVDALVKKGSPTDGHARTNTTSVYTAGGVFPMLPERLSYDLTSLNEDVDRLAMVIEMTVANDGAITAQDVYRALVRNRAQLAYDTVAAWLDEGGPAPARVAADPEVAAQIRLQAEAAGNLRRVRFEEGALTLQSIEARPVFDGMTIVDVAAQLPNRAKNLIEDLMVASNGVTARFLEDRGFPSLRRIVREPARWLKIVEVAKEYGEVLPGAPDSRALSAFLAARKKADPLRFPDLSLVIVKLMGPGEYTVERPGEDGPGHFGLAVKDYTHSTAPNRRYPDLITQRLLKAAIARSALPYSAEELDELARHCTDREDDANKVERRLRKSAAALLLSQRHGETFEGVVTGASDKGTWVRLLRPPVEGRVVRGFQGLDVGDRVAVTLLDTDVARGFIDFGRARGRGL
ncbi:MAG: RNB domain-containing ribonuclease [Acidobacteria bacterium]|nr:RNB domain-containing ribonuclease [Acidobacteriota bacterium]